MRNEIIINKKVYNRLIKDLKHIKSSQINFKNSIYDNTDIYVQIKDSNLYIHVLSDISLRRLRREEIIKTLIETNYQRKNNEWTSSTIIGFISEVLLLYYEDSFYYIKDKYFSGSPLIKINYPDKDDTINKKLYEEHLKEISKRYNVPINRFNTQLALFLLNLQNNKDNAGILQYFNYYELIIWKYRDINRLQDLIENNKVPAIDLLYLQNLGIIE